MFVEKLKQIKYVQKLTIITAQRNNCNKFKGPCSPSAMRIKSTKS